MPGEPSVDRAGIATTFRTTCLVVVGVAGLAGAVMMVSPDKTKSYFSWPIGPAPLATLVGAFYLASAGLFAILSRQDHWLSVRGVCFGILAFTLPTVVATIRHADLFDWDRWQALAWVALFVGSPITFSSFLFMHRGRQNSPPDVLPAGARAALIALAAAYLVLATTLLLTPARIESISPFDLPGLSGRFLGSWCAFLAVLALFSIWRDRRAEATIPIFALLAWPVAALVAAVRSLGELQPASRRTAYLVLLMALAGLAGTARVSLSRPEVPPEKPAIPSGGV